MNLQTNNRTLPILPATETRIPVTIITGFLGSGKTTLLNKLLQQPIMQMSAVIVNEFGEVGIDNWLVKKATEDVIIMEGGCVCCTVRGDLVETLQFLYTRRQNQEVPAFERVVIETTGLANPTPIIHTLMNEQELNHIYYLDNVIATIDCVYASSQFSEFYETVKQAAVADHIVLTKLDLAKEAEVDILRFRLSRLNPGATIFENINDNSADLSQLLRANLYDPQTKTLNAQQWLKAEVYKSDFYVEEKGTKITVQPTRHDQYVQSFCLEYSQPLTWRILDRWFRQLTVLRGKDLLRIKGIIYSHETELPVVIQGVQHIIQSPTTLPAWPYHPPSTKIVFITRNIEKSTLEEMLEIIVNSKTYVEACTATLVLLRHVA